jgi:hypothetical protein
VSAWDEARAQEAHDVASAMMAVELAGADLRALDGAPEAFEAGVWFGIAATLTVLETHGVIRLPRDGEPRE